MTIGRVAWHLAKEYNSFSIGWRIGSGEGFFTVEDQQRLSAAGNALHALWKIVSDVVSDAGNYVFSVLTDDAPEVEKLGEEYAETLKTAVTLIDQLRDEIVNMDDFEFGRLAGRIIGETIAIFGTGGVGAGLKSAAIIKIVPKLKQVSYIASRPGLVSKLDDALDLAELMSTSKMCFVAGTPVHVPGGTKPIEQLRAGDLVLTRNEENGVTCHKPVLQSFVTRPSRLYQITYTDEHGHATTCTSTGQHPFYVRDERRFVPAKELRPGHQLDCYDDTPATVSNVVASDVPENESVQTFNIEVADHHTYFVDDHGVWVHNTGAGRCEKVFEIFNRTKRDNNLDSWGGF